MLKYCIRWQDEYSHHQVLQVVWKGLDEKEFSKINTDCTRNEYKSKYTEKPKNLNHSLSAFNLII